MRHLCNILDKLDQGSENVIREHLDLALGVWSAKKGTSHKIVAVSESSVAFADADANLFVGRYMLAGGKTIITEVRRLLNVNEEINNTSFLDEFSAKFVNLIAEDQEDEASKLVGLILEMKQKAMKAVKLVEQKESKEQRARFLTEAKISNWRMIQEAKKSARKAAFKKASAIRLKLHNEGVKPEGLDKLTEAAVAMLASLEISARCPVIEGFVVARTEAGTPSIIRPKGMKTLISLLEDDDEKPWEKKDDEDKKDDDKSEDKKDDDDKDEHEKGESKEEEKKEHEGKSEKEEDAKDKKDDDKKDDDKSEDKKDDDKKDDDKKDDDKKDDDKKSDEGVVVINLNTIRETADPKLDFFFRASQAWKGFRAEPIDEATATLIKNNSKPSEIVKETPFLALLSEEEVYAALTPFVESFDPTDIKILAKAIVSEGETESGKKAKEDFLINLGDNEIAEAIRTQKLPMSTQLDALFLEAEDFDFGAADDLGNDDLNDDASTDGMGGPDQEDELGMDGAEDNLGGEDEMGGEEIQFSMPADQARETLTKVMDVIGGEIEDSEEFDELKNKLDDPEQEINGDDVVAMLQTVGDYFDAVGKDQTDQDEQNSEDEMGDENLDDMTDLEGDTEGDQGQIQPEPAGAGANKDQLNLGQ